MNKTQKSDSVNRAANDTVARTSRSHFRLSVGRLIFCAVVLAASNALLADTPAPKSASQGDTANIPHSSPLAPVPSSFNWRAWEELPVFHDGRVMPLVTFARITVKTVCGRNSPTLELDTGIIEEAQRDGLLGEREIARLHAKFADGKRKFRDAELIFSWLVEPEIWEYIPFLAASDRELRSEVAAQPAMGKYVSPYQVKKHAVNVQRRIDQWEKVQANQLDDREIEKLGADGLASLRTVGPAAVKLHESYRAYRSLINEANALPVYQLSLTLSQAERQMQNAYRMQLTLERVPVDFSQLGEPIPFVRGELNTLYQDINELAVNVQRAMRNEAAKPVTHQTLEADFERLLVEIDRLLPETVRFRDAMFTLRLDTIPRQVGVNAERLRMARELAAQMQYSLLQSRQWCESACLSLHDAGGSAARPHTMQIYPALVAESIKTDRSYPMQSRDMFSQNREYSETTRMPVWLTLHTLLFGSDDMIRRFAIPDLPEEERGAGGEGRGIRSTFYEMKAAYLSLESPETGATDRKEQIAHFNRASLEFAVELRASAEAVAQLRRDLVPPELRDNDLLTKTAYPAQSLMRAEYNYECLRPFYLMWVTSAAALALLLASAVASLFRAERAKDAEMYNPSVLDAGRNSSANSARKSYRIVEATLFWCGFAMLLVSQLVTLTGACYRAYITGWAPVTNMFETIVLMAFSVAAIGIWFTCKPLFGDRLLCAWRVAALPKGTSQRTSTAQSSSDTSKIERRFVLWQLILLPIRVVLAIVTLYYILLLSYGEASGGQLTWEVVRQGIAIKDPIDLTVVVVSIALLVWLVPRVILTLTLFPFVGASGFRLQTSGSASNVTPEARSLKPEACHDRKLFLIVGAALALAAGLAAYFGDSMFSPNIRPLMAVLRSNFWLTVHVFAIIIGYASGAIAWLLAVIACGMCIVGRWHTQRLPDGRYTPQMPDRAEALMPYIFSMLRWTMLLIAVGTILGARWADYSWGRFWGWDPKEVWALVTLLFYIIVLHGRAARWYGSFGVMLGALFGAIAIIMTWYGANVIFKTGRHAYGGTDTDFATRLVIGFIIANLLWGTLALLRLILQKIIADSQAYVNRR